MLPHRSQGRSPARWTTVLITDLLLVLLFAVLGRAQHESGLSASGIASTAAPFLVACLAGWSVTQNWNSPIRLWPGGVLVWLITVIGGLTLRAFFDHPPALSFQIVALLVIGAMLIGHRLVARALNKGRAASEPNAK